MRETRIRLNVDDVSDFVRAAAECDFDVDVKYNRILVDAKSILGVMSMDLNHVLTVKCYGESPRFESFLQRYAVA
ncbi:MAG: HPr family phosphocarrier protein [Lachnospiraceae bacterium]|jgi:Phosphotransferase system, HPr-related proteins|nr:HPr family phosphocarrier protein [Lachnospiraceae bacterium]MCI9658324.1 HPr family phosphocarrier protein [Lachnospiraceae bacterium]